MSDRQNAFPPSVNVGRLYERTSSKGNVYLTGFFGTMKITALKSNDTSTAAIRAACSHQFRSEKDL